MSQIPEAVNPLVQFAVNMARYEIETTGGIHPWGAGMSAEGKMTVWRLPPGGPPMEPMAALRQVMGAALVEVRATLFAGCIFVLDAKVRAPAGEIEDAVMLFLETPDEAWTLVLGYSRLASGEYEWKQIVAQSGEQRVFAR